MHSCMHMETHNWLKQEALSLFFSFVQSKLSEYQLCVPNWEYSSEHDGAYHPAASESITSIILTSLLLYVLWNRPGAKGRFNRKCWPTSRIRQGLCEEETLRIGKVGNGRVLWADRRASVPALMQEDIYWTESQPVWLQSREWRKGDAR